MFNSYCPICSELSENQNESYEGENVENAFLNVSRLIMATLLQICKKCGENFAKKLKICNHCGEPVEIKAIAP